MSIRFKFRSSVNFDSIEIDGGKPYISVFDLRSKILQQKKINAVCHKDFDLVFLDHVTGQEYNDDEFKIPSGSSVIIKRVPAEPVLRHHKPKASELREDVPKGMDHNKPEEIVLENNLAPEDREHIKLEKVADAKSIDWQKVDLPSELRCPICVTYFKEAVMIPCCQHSFCKKCICEVLPVTSRCPKCSSTKYRVEHLLPNLSLRHAIEHFIESQILATAPESDLQKYVPDEESGIQGKEISPVTKRKLDMLCSTSAMDKGSNQNMADSVHESLMRKILEGTGFHADSQGENQPVLPQVCMHDEADSTSRKRGPFVSSGGGDRNYAVENRNKKSGRTCYKCGSPGHFIRDCPIASIEHPMLHTADIGDHMFQGGMSGYAMPYWNAAAFPYVNPYMYMYGSYPGMVPFNSTMAPVTPYGVPPYVPSTYGSLHVPSGVTRTRGMAPVGSRAEQPFRYSENFERENSDSRVKCSHERRQRSSDYEDNGIQNRHDYHEPDRSSDYKSHRDRGTVPSNSEGSHGRKSLKDHQKMKSGHTRYEKRSHGSNHTDRSVSGIEDVYSGNNRSDEARHKKYHHESSRRHHSSREQSDSDCSYSRHQIKKENYVKTRQMEDRKKMMTDSDDDYRHNKRKRVH
ncbi:putative transcription factor interactor and regulator CCHC(Zn) family [Helianthus annuus]|uniref:Putative zinc finger, CCHC-type, Zinc finger, RING/FYVE/PHD-type, DWNN domain protein n=1 Tax=Helianthus annuus TaxID=4232 RepID=A0A251TYB3_HELAN|nr:E3 ubiquitin ligase PARAQUAT TOLERANCE 3 [Helianthus annuus]KAF5802603.1 putative transcription factor interactor and regulator CCHC(Zn) family [Helianthus annuus]KAJ0560707.1 putative transcription factor interactor and regulator CCHC(Zn) family [Helianthus annuus]KAJ0567096.1 putative transcription factor interactor and regulator CCHC(Zn) family [Helianthus annuus]KAJ0573743.1 putative transcription factor interactor and regulator CCHC(Zn) family [Helianthus annuus]KAJ0738079.1 putative t